MRLMSLLMAACAVAMGLGPASAQPAPEIQRQSATPQASGVVHTLRAIPEACVRFEGVFTGEQAEPYRLTPVSTTPPCQPRARMVDFSQAQPSEAQGWIYNDVIRVPSAGCPSQMATLQVWRKPAAVAPPVLDGQGRSRIYLEEARQKAAAGALPAGLPLYTVAFRVEGAACR